MVDAVTALNLPVTGDGETIVANLDAIDRSVCDEALDAIGIAQQAIGAEVEDHQLQLANLHAAIKAEETRHAAAQESLLKNLSAARVDMGRLTEVYTKKYIKGPGRFDFRPEQGVFIVRQE